MIKDIIVLGCGGLSDKPITNTAFLIRDSINKNNYLVDCGYNIFDKLLKSYPNEIEKIQTVYITHCHADHVGSLGQLIYYRYFKYKKTTMVYTSEEVKDSLEHLLSIMVTRVVKHDNSIFKFDMKCYYVNHGSNTFPVNHMNMPATGFYIPIYQSFDREYVIFTGDTDILNHNSLILKEAKVIFHDCCPHTLPPNIHSYIGDIVNKYSKDIKNKIILVHHGITTCKTLKGIPLSKEDQIITF